MDDLQMALDEEVIDDFDEFEGYNVENLYENDDANTRLVKRYVRDARDPFDWLRGEEFSKRYRFSKEAVRDVLLPIVARHLQKNSMHGLPIPALQQLLLCLRFYATGSFQVVCGDLFHVSQGTTSNIVKPVSHILAETCQQYIKFPSTRLTLENNRGLFRTLGRRGEYNGIPGIDGAIDCCHIKIVHTIGQQRHEAFRNRKSFFSINVQAVAGPSGEFLDIVARWAGSTHDSRIFSMSRLNARYLQRELDGTLLGDSGYPSLPFLFTPILRPQNETEIRYNHCHAKARNIVERMFGIWKRRFPCLSRGLGNKLETVSKIIVSCVILHNIALRINDVLPEEQNGEVELPDDDVPVPPPS